jgi:hypothetical protein
MRLTLKNIYILLISFSLLACLYSLIIPGIGTPTYPVLKLGESLKSIHNDQLLRVVDKDLDQDSSDRKLSKLYTYEYGDGSKILSIMVRVRKRDDFRIETYGQLTKNIKQIYILNPTSTNTVPYSLQGLLGSKQSIQTCIVPGTSNSAQADVRLDGLLTSAASTAPRERDYLAKILGTEAQDDYSCLVLTYQPSSLNKAKEVGLQSSWSSIIGKVQSALAK